MKSSSAPLPRLKSAKVLDQLPERIRYLHYSIRTEEVYVHWVRAFIRFHRLRHPASMGSVEVEEFLAWLANTRYRFTRQPRLDLWRTREWRALGRKLGRLLLADRRNSN